MFTDVLDESVRLWRTTGTPQSAVAFVHQQLASAESREYRGRLLGLAAKWEKRVGTSQAVVEAFRHQSEAIDMVQEPAHVADALCNIVDICVDMRRVEQGVRYADRMTGLLQQQDDPSVMTWEAPFLHNYGRLLALAGDHATAVPKLERSMVLFSDAGQVDEADTVAVALANALLDIGQLDRADELCRRSKENTSNPRVLVHINTLQSRLAMARGDLNEAARFLEKAITMASESVGRSDFRIVVQLLQAEADLDVARGDSQTARRLRLLAQTWASTGRVDH